MTNKLIFAFLVLTLTTLACRASLPGALVGSGNVVTESFAVKDFDQVRLGAPGTLYIQQGDAFGLTIETDDNILSALQADVTMGVLRLNTAAAYTTIRDTTLIYRLSLPVLSALDLSGSGDVFLADLSAASLFVTVSGSGDLVFSNAEIGSLEINLNGSGNVNHKRIAAEAIVVNVNGSGDVMLAGTSETIKVVTSGSGKLLAEELITDQAEVFINGSGDASLWVRDALTVGLGGSGDVRYRGTPSIELVHTSSSGELIPLGGK